MKSRQNKKENTVPSSLSGIIKGYCANYKEGKCLPYDKECYMFREWDIATLNSTNPQIHRGLKICRYFKYCVLPLNKELYNHVCEAMLERDKNYTTQQILSQVSAFYIDDDKRPEYLDPIKAKEENREFISLEISKKNKKKN